MWIGSSVAWLNENFDSLFGQLLDMRWCQWSSSFPGIDGFSSDSQNWRLSPDIGDIPTVELQIPRLQRRSGNQTAGTEHFGSNNGEERFCTLSTVDKKTSNPNLFTQENSDECFKNLERPRTLWHGGTVESKKVDRMLRSG